MILTISFLILLSFFFISAIYDSHSYAAEYVELAISDRMQRIASIISIPQKNVFITLSIFTTVNVSIIALIYCWFMIVIVRCAKYFRDLKSVKQSVMRKCSTE
ncbi:putative integral membrane protein [Brugia pahangi]